MATIEFERWKRSVHDPGKWEYAGQRNAVEVFEELRARLEWQGCLPDEYFLIDADWEHDREIPKDADVFAPRITVEARASILMSVSNGMRTGSRS